MKGGPGINPVMWHAARWTFGPALRIVFRMRRTGHHHIPREGPVLIVSSHVSVKDPPFMGAALLPRATGYMAKSELFRSRAFAWLISGLGAFPVVRGGADREAIRTARDRLRQGACLLMFPEGTRSKTGILGPGMPGAGALALDPAVTVVPAAIWGTRSALGPVSVVFGPPIDLSDLDGGARGARTEEASRRIMRAIADLVPKAGGPEQPEPRLG
jgi:1-acyl-sn-glycerol-3-phosphate acyltransferase